MGLLLWASLYWYVFSAFHCRRIKPNLMSCLQTGKKPTSSAKSTKKRSSAAQSKTSHHGAPKTPSSSLRFDCVDVMTLVGEVTRSKDETIDAKNEMIRFLHSSLESTRRICAACGVNAGSE